MDPPQPDGPIHGAGDQIFSIERKASDLLMIFEGMMKG
jgi:hypothetical protein